MSITPASQQSPETKTPGKSVQTFRALRYRNFGLLWIRLIVSSVRTWMQIVAQALLVLKITNNSPFALGIVALAQSLSLYRWNHPAIGGSIYTSWPYML